jgi:hypothetical protein
MQQIYLSQGQSALVDDTDYPLLSDFRWSYRGEPGGRQGYAVRHHKVNGKDRLLYLHRHLMQPGPGQEVVFLNHDSLDCRRENLRVVSKGEARQHHRVRRDSKSGIKGVRYNNASSTWSTFVYRNGLCQHVGTFYSPEQAVQAYQDELKKENPDLHRAPEKVERSSAEGSDQRANPDRPCPGDKG